MPDLFGCVTQNVWQVGEAILVGLSKPSLGAGGGTIPCCRTTVLGLVGPVAVIVAILMGGTIIMEVHLLAIVTTKRVDARWALDKVVTSVDLPNPGGNNIPYVCLRKLVYAGRKAM